jgi:UDP-N-acetylglucosamine 2-epimerase
MKPACRKAWDHYEEGRITATGFIINFLNAADPDDLREALDILPADLLEKLREFLREYRPDMRVFRGDPPSPGAVAMAREVLAEPVKSG